MTGSKLHPISVSIASDSIHQRNALQSALERSGLNIIANEPLSLGFITKLNTLNPQVLILDLDEDKVIDDTLLNQVLEDIDIPIIFNDVVAMSRLAPKALKKWQWKLAKKIYKVAGQAELFDSTLLQGGTTHNGNACRVPTMYESQEMSLSNIHLKQVRLATNVWVLGASLGGPEAVKRFLNVLNPDINAAFILAQHLGSNFVKLLAEQLTRSTPFVALKPRVGHVLRHGEIIVAPVAERLVINPLGAIELRPIENKTAYSPSIDMIISDMATRFGNKSGTIIFSGMGNDGAETVNKMKQIGCPVWAQDEDSCVISSMPDQVRSTGMVDFSGTPEQLAEKMNQYMGC